MSRPPADSSPVQAGPGQPATAAGDPAAPTPAGNADTGARRPTHPAAPAWALRVLATSGALLALVAGGWLLVSALLRVPLLTVTVALALLLAALVQPMARWLRHLRLHRAVAALLTVLLLAGILTCVGLLVGFRAAARLRDLTQPLAAGIDRIRVWLVEGPLGLDPQQATGLRNTVVNEIYELSPEPVAATRMALEFLASVVLVAFLLFFFLRDGTGMWSWLLERVPERRRGQVDGAGRCAWTALSHYVRAVVVVALLDAVGIGAALLVLGVPLWLSLTLLTFVGAFVPLFGATVSGAVAVLVTLVTNGPTDAIVVLVVVLVVQQVEGNLLHPLIVGRSVRLHPATVLVAVTAGTLLWGIAGALLAVPLTAVTYRVVEYVRHHPVPPSDGCTPVPLTGQAAGHVADSRPVAAALGRGDLPGTG